MVHSELISDYLRERGDYPEPPQTPGGGLVITMESGCLIVAGDSCDLIDLADLLVSLALSGEDRGQHWHVDQGTLVSETFPIGELILERNDKGAGVT